MKVLTRTLSLLTIAALTLFFANCGGDEKETPKEKTQLGKLSKTWNVVTADLDGDDRTSDFTNFKLTVGGTFNSSNPEGPYNFSVQGSRPEPSPWPANGTWLFTGFAASGDEGNLLRDDGVNMHYVIQSNGTLMLEVECDDCDYAGAKVGAVNGVWTFTFN
jgi:hypothetical protein